MIEAPVQFGTPALEETLQLVAGRLRERNLEVIIVEDGAAARTEVLARVPKFTAARRRHSKRPASQRPFTPPANMTRCGRGI